MSKIKLCGLCRNEDIEAVNRARPDFAGFIINYPKSHRSLSLQQASLLMARLPASIRPVAVFVDAPLEELLALRAQNPIIQLHGAEDAALIAALYKAWPGVEVWQAYCIQTKEDVQRAEASPADLPLLDSGKGSGKPFDWALLSGFARPYMLAGGLDAQTVQQAIKTLRPFGVDASSGVETDQRKDAEKMLRFCRTVRGE